MTSQALKTKVDDLKFQLTIFYDQNALKSS